MKIMKNHKFEYRSEGNYSEGNRKEGLENISSFKDLWDNNKKSTIC